MVLAAIDMMFIIDVVVIVYGLYTLYSGISMKKTKLPAKWLVAEQEMSKCRDKEGFAMAIYGKTILFGALVLVYGMASLLNEVFWKNRIVNLAGVLFFLAVCAYYIVQLNRARKKFF